MENQSQFQSIFNANLKPLNANWANITFPNTFIASPFRDPNNEVIIFCKLDEHGDTEISVLYQGNIIPATIENIKKVDKDLSILSFSRKIFLRIKDYFVGLTELDKYDFIHEDIINPHPIIKFLSQNKYFEHLEYYANISNRSILVRAEITKQNREISNIKFYECSYIKPCLFNLEDDKKYLLALDKKLGIVNTKPIFKRRCRCKSEVINACVNYFERNPELPRKLIINVGDSKDVFYYEL